MRCQNEACFGAECEFYNGGDHFWRCPVCGWTWHVETWLERFWRKYRKEKGFEDEPGEEAEDS